ncbi:MAG: hypothetical protein M0P01_10780 [Treponema sp.]|nr:hypothetical protein [Treponema sp.]
MEEIKLDSGLNEYAFGKTDFSAMLTDEGFIAEADGMLTAGTEFAFRAWRFDKIKTIGKGDDAHVWFCGRGFSGTSLAELFDAAAAAGADNKSKYTAVYASFAVCLALSQILKKHIPAGNMGAGGIYVNSEAEKIRILFLPAPLYDTVCGCKGAETYALLQGIWCSKALAFHADAALSFTRAVIAYRGLTGHLPYESGDETTRNADELDKNYLRLEHAVNGINKVLAESVDTALELPSLAQQKKAPAVLPVPDLPPDIFYSELGLNGTEILRTVPREGALPSGEFNAKVEAYYKSKKKKVNAKRTIRRNTAMLTGAAAAVVVITVIAVVQHHDNGNKPTSRGLTSSQTVEAFYKAIHTQDIELLDSISRGKAANRYSDSVSQIYVTNKTRNLYDYTDSMITPESWLYSQSQETTQEKRSIFGITSFMLDGQSCSLLVDVPKRNIKPLPVTVEGSTTLSNGCKAVHTADFYIIHTEGENNDIYAEHHTDHVTLTYKDDRWIITDIKPDAEEIQIDSGKFKSDFITACNTDGGDSLQAVLQLKPVYEWLPDSTVMKAEIDSQKPKKAQIQ